MVNGCCRAHCRARRHCRHRPKLPRNDSIVRRRLRARPNPSNLGMQSSDCRLDDDDEDDGDDNSSRNGLVVVDNDVDGVISLD